MPAFSVTVTRTYRVRLGVYEAKTLAGAISKADCDPSPMPPISEWDEIDEEWDAEEE